MNLMGVILPLSKKYKANIHRLDSAASSFYDACVTRIQSGRSYLVALGRTGVYYFKLMSNNYKGYTIMYFTQSPTETSAYGRLRNCRDELDAVISVLNTLNRSIESNEEEIYRSDAYLVSLVQSDLEKIQVELDTIQNSIVPEQTNFHKPVNPTTILKKEKAS